METEEESTCANCKETLYEPYIECCKCNNINLCTTCFSTGQKVGTHENDHPYAVRKNNFTLFENCNWTAKEEIKLLSAISNYGYGNWEEVSKVLQTRSKLECQEHYRKYFIEKVQNQELDLLQPTVESTFPKPIIPFLYSMKVCEDPPRNATNSNQYLAGYNAFRSDFEYSYDNNAEALFNIDTSFLDNDDDDNDDCIEALKLSLLSALNNRLRERHRRYLVIKEHGLIMLRKLTAWLQIFDKTFSRINMEKLIPVMQLMTGMQFEILIHSLSYEIEKLQRIVRLCEYRRIGIKTFYAARFYEEMKIKHEDQLRQQKYYKTVISHSFESKLIEIMNIKSRNLRILNKAKPLDIIDFPDFSLLSDSERILCTNIRLVPRNYLEIKRMLIIENNKLGYLKLLDARRIAKIDVNKTRKIYDFLLAEGFIKQPH